ncbi:foldase protein PrsA [Paenibacillus sp. B01]|uniref:foldase protein PrsA n=1 Tax=Paenibacillus sp. B01 TaxID=2660554 RepID=UPI00129B5003|nr:peptidylprolyl isomerase [Paenibacillus sp. B01]QGG58041.1 peptidylprolyl isomerase [Paenibacillus sp. B01]
MAENKKDPLDANGNDHLTPEDTATREGADFAGDSGSERREETIQAEEEVEERRTDDALRRAEYDAEVHTADPERAFGSLPVAPVAGAADLPLDNDGVHGDGDGGRPKRSGAATGWMIASLVLAVGLIIALVSLFSNRGGEAVATVNGEKITKDELYDMLAPTYGKSALDQLVTMKLVDQEADNKSVAVTEEEENAELEDIKKNFTSEAEFENALAQSGMSLDDLKKQMLMQVQMRKLLADQVKVSDEDIKKNYEENKESFATPEQVQASHILVATKEEADAIEKQLKNGGDFAAIAKEKSTDTGSAANGGDLGFFGKGSMVPEFEEAAFGMKVGEISAPIKSDYGYHIIKLVDRKEATTPTLEDKKEEIRKTLENQQLSTLSQTLITDLRAKATITNTLDPSQNTNGSAEKNGSSENAPAENAPAENAASNSK